MINMISLNGFDQSEIQNSSLDGAEKEAAFDEFSALLAAFAPIPGVAETPVLRSSETEAETPVLQVLETENEIAEQVQPRAESQNSEKTGEQVISFEKTAGRSVIQIDDSIKPFVNIQAGETFLVSKSVTGKAENSSVGRNESAQNPPPEIFAQTELPEEPLLDEKAGQNRAVFESVKGKQNQSEKKFQEIRFSEIHAAKPNSAAQSNEPFNPIQTNSNENLHIPNFSFSNTEDKVTIEQIPSFAIQSNETVKPAQTIPNKNSLLTNFSYFNSENKTAAEQGSQENPAPPTTIGARTETKADQENKADFPPQTLLGNTEFSPKKSFFFALPRLFREVSAKLKLTEEKLPRTEITNASAPSEQTNEFAFEPANESTKTVERGAIEIKPNLPENVGKKLDLPHPQKAVFSLPVGTTTEKSENIKITPAAAPIAEFASAASLEASENGVKTVADHQPLKIASAENKTIQKATPESAVLQVFERLLAAVGRESKPVADQTPFPAQSERIFEQIASRLTGEISVFARATEETNIIEMRLRPAELGVVEVRMEKSDSGAIQVHLNAESDATQQILTADLDRLRESLQTAGWQIERLEVSSGLSSSTGSENRENSSRQTETVETGFVQTDDFDQVSENTEDSTPNRLVNLRA